MAKIIIFEGVDGVGKTTIKLEIEKLTNEFVLMDRGFASSWVYGKYHEKENTPSIQELIELEGIIRSNAMYVLVEANIEDIISRCMAKNEESFKLNVNEIMKVKELYNFYFAYSNLKLVRVNTSEESIIDCANFIIESARNLNNIEIYRNKFLGGKINAR